MKNKNAKDTDRICEECGGRIIETYSDLVCEDCGIILGPRTVGLIYETPWEGEIDMSQEKPEVKTTPQEKEDGTLMRFLRLKQYREMNRLDIETIADNRRTIGMLMGTHKTGGNHKTGNHTIAELEEINKSLADLIMFRKAEIRKG